MHFGKKQANCRYGPGKAYLYAWGMYTGDTAEVRLPQSTLYDPPKWVKAVREDDEVIVTWGRYP